MKRLLALAAAGALVAWGVATTASALPVLQLDIKGGTYVSGSEETTFGNGNSFTLFALLTAPTAQELARTYLLSFAVTPPIHVAADLGAFKVNGVSIAVTGDMEYGTPPVNALYPDLPPHGQYPTY